jgi:PAS domain S-box-containing protein
MVFIHNPYTSKNTARLFLDIGSLGWISFSSFFLLIILALSGNEKILKKKWFYLLLFGIPLLLIYKQWTNFIFTDFSKEYYGWKPLYSATIWPHIYYIYYALFMIAGFYINIKLIKSGKAPVKKKQAKIILFSVVISLILGSLTDVILPLMKIHVLPNIASSILLIWAFSVVYAMVKYKFLAITPAAATANIISTMFDSLILLNMEGKIQYINKAVSDLSGYREEELKGMPLSTLFPEQNSETGPVDKIIKESDFKNRDFFFMTKTGRNIPVLFSSSLLHDEAGFPKGIVCVVRDISERKKLEEEMLKSKKLESTGILAGGIAHDFNNLLTIIMINLSLIQDTMDPGDKRYKYLQKADETSQKAADLTGKFLLLIPGLPVNRKKIALSTILKNIRESGLSKNNFELEINLPNALYSLYGDESQLKRVIQDLLLNAVEAMSHGGKIRIAAENITVDNHSKLLLKPGRYVKILIIDNGSGIQQKYMEKIFDPYFSTKARVTHKGMGLGLTICYAIIKKHEGHITAASAQGEGTTVTLYLPAHRSSGC